MRHFRQRSPTYEGRSATSLNTDKWPSRAKVKTTTSLSVFYVSVRTTGFAMSRLQCCPSTWTCAPGCFWDRLPVWMVYRIYKPPTNNNLIQRAVVWLTGEHRAAEIQQQHPEQHQNPHLISIEETSLSSLTWRRGSSSDKLSLHFTFSETHETVTSQ